MGASRRRPPMARRRRTISASTVASSIVEPAPHTRSFKVLRGKGSPGCSMKTSRRRNCFIDKLKWLAAPPNPDGLPIEKEFAHDDQGLRRWLCRADDLIHVENRYWSTFANRSSRA